MGIPASNSHFGTSYLTSASRKNNSEIQKQVQELLEAKLIEKSYSSYSFRVTLAYKKGEGTTRLCIHYRKVNPITKSEPLPWIVYAKYFSTLDLSSSYWHIQLNLSDMEKLAFVTNQNFKNSWSFHLATKMLLFNSPEPSEGS